MPEPAKTPSGLRFSPWNLLLLVPFLMLVVPWFNSIEPTLFGLPFFYWAQFAFVPVGVVCVAIVYVTTRTEPKVPPPGPHDVESLDERTAGDGAADGAADGAGKGAGNGAGDGAGEGAQR